MGKKEMDKDKPELVVNRGSSPINNDADDDGDLVTETARQPLTDDELENGIEAPLEVIGADTAPNDDTVAFPCYAVRRQSRGHELMLDFRFMDGTRQALAYAYLSSILFDPDKDKGIYLDFVGSIVHINGRKLQPIYDYLLQHRVMFVAEKDDRYDEGATFVDKITIGKPA